MGTIPLMLLAAPAPPSPKKKLTTQQLAAIGKSVVASANTLMDTPTKTSDKTKIRNIVVEGLKAAGISSKTTAKEVCPGVGQMQVQNGGRPSGTFKISDEELMVQLEKVSTPAGYMHAKTGRPVMALGYPKSRLCKLEDKVDIPLEKSQLCIS